ncbi:MAG: C45 family peptidase [Rubrivivax sp.]
MALTFHAVADGPDSAAWVGVVARLWPAYERWYLKEGDAARPSLQECREALDRHMPEFVPTWERQVALAGGGEGFARFLSLWRPPGYLSACTQAVWPGTEPLLVRNYDYSTLAFDAVCLHTQWAGRRIMGTSDCLIGLVDGINDAGLVASLTFGGRTELGPGFGMPIILRYLLDTCTTSAEAGLVLQRVPSHMAYNVTVLDADRELLTAEVAPGRDTVLTTRPVASNHQSREGETGLGATSSTAPDTIARERYLLQRSKLHHDSAEHFTGLFLEPPLYALDFERGFGTLYTAAYRPRSRTVEYRWPGLRWRLALDSFEPGSRVVEYPVGSGVVATPTGVVIP